MVHPCTGGIPYLRAYQGIVLTEPTAFALGCLDLAHRRPIEDFGVMQTLPGHWTGVKPLVSAGFRLIWLIAVS